MAAVGEVLYGAFEARPDMGKLLLDLNGISLLFDDLIPFLAGELTAEELAMKSQLRGGSAVAFGRALRDHPLEVGKEIAKGVLDWDAWTGNPARAVGHLVPDIVVAVATVGGGTVATKSSSLLVRLGAHADDVDDVAGATRCVDRVIDAAEASRKLDKLDFTSVGKSPKDFSPKLGLTKEGWEHSVSEWIGEVSEANPGLDQDSVRGLHRYTVNGGYTNMNDALRSGGGSPETHKLIEDATRVLDRLPTSEPGDLHRGTALSKGVVDKTLDEGVFSDPAFLSTSRDSSVAARFAETAVKNSPDNIPVEFRIKNGTTPDTQSFSAYANEAEHLYKPGAKFGVAKMVERQFGSKQGWKVVMKKQQRSILHPERTSPSMGQ